MRFESAKIDSLYPVLDAVSWMDCPTSAQVAQFANVDPRTAGKLLKNATQLGIIDKLADGYMSVVGYPYKGTIDQKKNVVREALVRLPLLVSVRQFLQLGDDIENSLRKAATVAGISPYEPKDLNPIITWAKSLDALESGLIPEDLIDEAVSEKEKRHIEDITKKVAFLSHSSGDKDFIRQLAADLSKSNVEVWLDEQNIKVGDSIPEKISQGLAHSDYFMIAISDHSNNSEWVQRELNAALMAEMDKRDVKIFPLKLDSSSLPEIINDKMYADFSSSYKHGLTKLLSAIGVD